MKASRARGAVGAQGTVLLAALAFGCGGPRVEARAVWLDRLEQDDGSRRVHVYDRGELSELPLSLPADVQTVRAQLGPNGRGLLLRGDERNTTYIDLLDGRFLPMFLTLPPLQAQDTVEFTASGDAVMWREEEHLRVLPVFPGADLDWSEEGDWLEPLEAPLPGLGWLLSPLRAPLVFASDSVSAQGQTVAFRYVNERDGKLGLEEVGRTDMKLPTNDPSNRIFECHVLRDCGADWALDPFGETLTGTSGISTNPDCWGQQWRWKSGSEPTCLSLPEELRSQPAQLRLLTALNPDQLVLHDDLRLYLWNTTSGDLRMSSVVGLAPFGWRFTPEGEAVVFMSISGGAMTRIDRSGFDQLAVSTTSCDPGVGIGGLRISPNGRWAAWGCQPQPSEADVVVDLDTSVVLRASANGVERFEGIPMVMLAIDDDGDVLMYSAENAGSTDPEGVQPDLEPLSLWTLSADGALRRTDRLEPTPQAVVALEGTQTVFIQARALK